VLGIRFQFAGYGLRSLIPNLTARFAQDAKDAKDAKKTFFVESGNCQFRMTTGSLRFDKTFDPAGCLILEVIKTFAIFAAWRFSFVLRRLWLCSPDFCPPEFSLLHTTY
jgi:hypothetical protein